MSASWPAPLDSAQDALDARRVSGIGLYVVDTPSTCLLGGIPEVPEGFVWPAVNAVPMAFLAQLDLAQLHRAAPLEWLPERGRLLFFYDVVEESWGIRPEDIRHWHVAFVPDGVPLAPATPPEPPVRHFTATIASPAGLRREARSETVELTFGRVFLSPRHVDTWPDFHDPLLMRDVFGHLTDTPELKESYDAFRAHHLPRPQHQVDGMPFTLQNPRIDMEAQMLDQGIPPEDFGTLPQAQQERTLAGFEDWYLLLQLDSDDDAGWMWGDSGVLYFLILGQDARRGDFSRVRAILHCF